jgi:arginine decarboxylase
MRYLDTPEIHGYLPDFGYRVYTEKSIEMADESVGATPNGHRSRARAAAPSPKKTSKKKSAKRGGPNGDRNVQEIGHDELLGQRQPGDALTASAPPGDQGILEVGADELTGEQQPGDAVQADTGS